MSLSLPPFPSELEHMQSCPQSGNTLFPNLIDAESFKPELEHQIEVEEYITNYVPPCQPCLLRV
ncbi:hypothetical protein L211DRAFT_372776 [Terfezia boudieri ATCC MYA-4762]|uniref:Uncharacterized protein n=1 Tax=Terfezia boudieri ATCC MYA-4762 TaxID=1051890 RepID=A0A3N4M327_9PEZI|nr:hypothetical protein L211DRAFT_372776 [Terfezia boudieri ATCC MYA-4762]